MLAALQTKHELRFLIERSPTTSGFLINFGCVVRAALWRQQAVKFIGLGSTKNPPVCVSLPLVCLDQFDVIGNKWGNLRLICKVQKMP